MAFVVSKVYQNMSGAINYSLTPTEQQKIKERNKRMGFKWDPLLKQFLPRGKSYPSMKEVNHASTGNSRTFY